MKEQRWRVFYVEHYFFKFTASERTPTGVVVLTATKKVSPSLKKWVQNTLRRPSPNLSITSIPYFMKYPPRQSAHPFLPKGMIVLTTHPCFFSSPNSTPIFKNPVFLTFFTAEYLGNCRYEAGHGNSALNKYTHKIIGTYPIKKLFQKRYKFMAPLTR